MPVNSLHPDYRASLPAWTRAREVLAGEDSVKAAGERYLPRLTDQSDAEYADYLKRASFFNATARTADGYLGLVFRRAPFLTLPPLDTALGGSLAVFDSDADMLGTTFSGYARGIVRDVIGLGRAGSLIDWEPAENRAYVSAFAAEDILNWRVERINGRSVTTLIVLRERQSATEADDEFEPMDGDQIRVLKLVDATRLTAAVHLRAGSNAAAQRDTSNGRDQVCVVEIWRRTSEDWTLVETRVPMRVGEPLPLIPFVFHGPRHSRPEPDKLPLADLIAVNLDHYRLNADYKYGVHFTAFPTAWLVGFDPNQNLRIGSHAAWVAENPGAKAGFLEFTGQGLTTFERAMDRDERLLAVLGSRLLEPAKKVGETAEAIELRQSGENSVLGSTAISLSDSLTHVLRWVYWWHSTAALPDDVSAEQASVQLNTDFSVKGMSAQDLAAVVSAWQAGALSRETMVDLFRRGEVLPERSNAQPDPNPTASS